MLKENRSLKPLTSTVCTLGRYDAPRPIAFGNALGEGIVGQLKFDRNEEKVQGYIDQYGLDDSAARALARDVAAGRLDQQQAHDRGLREGLDNPIGRALMAGANQPAQAAAAKEQAKQNIANDGRAVGTAADITQKVANAGAATGVLVDKRARELEERQGVRFINEPDGGRFIGSGNKDSAGFSALVKLLEERISSAEAGKSGEIRIEINADELTELGVTAEDVARLNSGKKIFNRDVLGGIATSKLEKSSIFLSSGFDKELQDKKAELLLAKETVAILEEASFYVDEFINAREELPIVFISGELGLKIKGTPIEFRLKASSDKDETTFTAGASKDGVGLGFDSQGRIETKVDDFKAKTPILSDDENTRISLGVVSIENGKIIFGLGKKEFKTIFGEGVIKVEAGVNIFEPAFRIAEPMRILSEQINLFGQLRDSLSFARGQVSLIQHQIQDFKPTIPSVNIFIAPPGG